MGSIKVFTYVSNILGLNFVDVSASYVFIVIFQVLALAHGFYFSFYQKFSSWHDFPKDIYFVIDTFQLEYIYLLEILFVVRALTKQKIQRRIYKSINFELTLKDDSSERNTFLCFLLLVSPRLMKLSVAGNSGYFEYMIKPTFSELTMASSDLMFIFYISKLTAHLRHIRAIVERKSHSGSFSVEYRKLLANLAVKHEINQRYSLELFLTISYNFLHLIICLYYVFMRIRFNQLKRVSGETFCQIETNFKLTFTDFITFVYLVQPIFSMASLFCTYQNYSNEVI